MKMFIHNRLLYSVFNLKVDR